MMWFRTSRVDSSVRNSELKTESINFLSQKWRLVRLHDFNTNIVITILMANMSSDCYLLDKVFWREVCFFWISNWTQKLNSFLNLINNSFNSRTYCEGNTSIENMWIELAIQHSFELRSQWPLNAESVVNTFQWHVRQWISAMKGMANIWFTKTVSWIVFNKKANICVRS